jgi:hypothetical protein
MEGSQYTLLFMTCGWKRQSLPQVLSMPSLQALHMSQDTQVADTLQKVELPAVHAEWSEQESAAVVVVPPLCNLRS